MKRLLALSVVVLTTFAVVALHATPNEIWVIRGALQQPLDSTGRLDIVGTSGLKLEAALNPFIASFGWQGCENVPICLPGDVVSLRAAYGAHPPIFTGSGQATIQGRTYSLFDEASAEFEFDGAFVAPEFTDDRTAEVSAPFAFQGSLQVPSKRQPGTYDVFELHGSGVATAFLSRHPFHGGWVVGGVRYEFLPRGNVIVQ